MWLLKCFNSLMAIIRKLIGLFLRNRIRRNATGVNMNYSTFYKCQTSSCNIILKSFLSFNNLLYKMYLPIFVETTTALLRQMLSPNIDQSAKTEWSLNITNSTNHNHWWCLQNGHSLHHFLFVDLWNVIIEVLNKQYK